MGGVRKIDFESAPKPKSKTSALTPKPIYPQTFISDPFRLRINPNLRKIGAKDFEKYTTPIRIRKE